MIISHSLLGRFLLWSDTVSMSPWHPLFSSPLPPPPLGIKPMILVDWLIDLIDFYAVSAIFQPCNSGMTLVLGDQIFQLRLIIELPFLNFLLANGDLVTMTFTFKFCLKNKLKIYYVKLSDAYMQTYNF